MVESGVMDVFLKEYCPTENYKICAYKDSLPLRQWGFQWDPNSALYKTGGWQANEAEYNAIIHKTLTNPKYLALHMLKSTEATLRELPQIDIGGFSQQGIDSSPYGSVRSWFQHELREYLASQQNQGTLQSLTGFFSALILIVTFATFIVALLIKAVRRFEVSPPQATAWGSAFGFAILFIVINAFTTATFSTPISRFNARVFWILPFLCIAYIYNHVVQKRQGFSDNRPSV
jgi:hypothetical protein